MTTLSLLDEGHPQDVQHADSVETASHTGTLADNIPSLAHHRVDGVAVGSFTAYDDVYLTMCGTRIATHSYRTHRTACTRTLATKAKLGVVGESRDGYSAHRSIFQNALEDTCSPLVLPAHARVLSPVAVVHHQYLC